MSPPPHISPPHLAPTNPSPLGTNPSPLGPNNPSTSTSSSAITSTSSSTSASSSASSSISTNSSSSSSTRARELEIIEKFLHPCHLLVHKCSFFYHLVVGPNHLTTSGLQPTHHHLAPITPTTCRPPINQTHFGHNHPTTPMHQLTHLLYSPTNAPPLGPNHTTTPFPNHPTTHHTFPQPSTTCRPQSTQYILATITPPPLYINSSITHHTWPQPTHHPWAPIHHLLAPITLVLALGLVLVIALTLALVLVLGS